MCNTCIALNIIYSSQLLVQGLQKYLIVNKEQCNIFVLEGDGCLKLQV